VLTCLSMSDFGTGELSNAVDNSIHIVAIVNYIRMDVEGRPLRASEPTLSWNQFH